MLGHDQEVSGGHRPQAELHGAVMCSHACERQYQSRKRDDAHRLLHPTTDQIRKTMPEGLPTGV
jgi:hypothetical protein